MDEQPPPWAQRVIDFFRGWWNPFADVLRGPFMQLILLLLWLGVLGTAYFALAHARNLLIAVTASAICSLPKLLCFAVALVVTRAQIRKTVAFASDAADPSSYAVGVWTRALIQAQKVWADERDSIKKIHDRLFQHAGMYGFLSSLLLAGAAIAEAPINAKGERIAAAVAAATTVSFARDYGRMLVRAASRDLSARMVATCSRRLLLVAPAAAFFVLVLSSDTTGASAPNGASHIDSTVGAIAIGVAVALLGERAVDAATDRAASILGLPTLKPVNAFGLQQLDGIDEEVVLRLDEEGIDSVHALAFATTPRLFFSTKYPLKRICDWQDQALLTVVAGPSRAQAFRDVFAARGATSAARVSTRLLEKPEALEDVRKFLGLASVDQVQTLLAQLSGNEIAAILDVFRGATPRELDAGEVATKS